MVIRKATFLLLIFFMLWGDGVQATEIFVVPENLKDNVAFWKMIYSETSMKQGVFHDREYPLVIFRKVYIGNLKGRKRRNLIRKHAKEIKVQLRNILRRPPNKWSTTEKQIAAMYKVHGNMDQIKTAHRRIRMQQGQRERFKLGLERSGAYLHYIKNVFRQYNIPTRIAYLPHVESSFNIQAYSKVGAAGMWQFIRRTGKLFMKINYRVDERRDPFKSTIAAAKLLTRNYAETKAWPLAITAYNHGLASIKRAVRKTKSRDIGVIIDKYKNRRFRFASKNFYSCFLAASHLAMNADRYFSDIKYHAPQSYLEIPLRFYARPRTIARSFGISTDIIKELNPALRPAVFKRNLSIPKGFRLRLPPKFSMDEALGRLGKIPKSKIRSRNKEFIYYSVRRGDTLYAISNRFRVPIHSIMDANKIRSRHRLYIGQVLRIPRQVKKKTSKVVIAKKPEKVVTRKSIMAIPQNQSNFPPATRKIELKEEETFDATLYHLDIKENPARKTAWITVSVNETLGHYADWLMVPASWIRNLNSGRRSIQIGQRILIPLSRVSVEDFSAKRLEHHMSLEEDFYDDYRVSGTKTHRIRRGENIWALSQEEEIPLWLLKKFNLKMDFRQLKVGTKIIIPLVEKRN